MQLETIEKIEKIEIAPELLKKTQKDVEKQVIVHCTLQRSPYMEWDFRIWPTIYLFPKEGMRKCKLIQHFNIVLYPQWQTIGPTGQHQFTLIFQGLPKECKQFDIKEIIPEPVPFMALNINRNDSDVYYINF